VHGVVQRCLEDGKEVVDLSYVPFPHMLSVTSCHCEMLIEAN